MILMVDNYDSFTYNLVQLLVVEGARIDTVRNDEFTAEELLSRSPRGIVLSPGPGRPESAGVCLDLLRLRPSIPILGVCLGHQAIATVFGGRVDRAERLMHGKTSQIQHRGQGLFEGIESPFEATRYHSLDVKRDSLPDELEEIAWTDDGTIMAISHRTLPYWGVQFHPESILTENGDRLARNFLARCRQAERDEEQRS
jgi:anthranilate synthase/aminodeoxychorismate synthase-like glutamine amidotransferase